MSENMSYLSFMINELACTFPCHLFGYVPFWSYSKFSKAKTLTIFIVTQVIYMLYCSLIYFNHLPYNYAKLLALPIYGISFFICFNMEIGKLIFLYIFTVDYCMIIRGVSTYLNSLLDTTLSKYILLQNGLITIALFVFTMPAMLLYYKKTTVLVNQIDAPMVWKKIWILPLFTSILVLIYTFPMDVAHTTALAVLSRVILMISMFLIYYYIIQSLLQFHKYAQVQDQIRHLEQLTQLQAEHYELLHTRIEETKRARHDLRQHLRAIQGYIDNKDTESLNTYLKNLTGSLPLDTPPCWSGNPTVDAVLGFYAQKAYEEGIDIEISFQTQPQTIIPEHEFCVLLGNLLENALDACTSASDRQRSIRVHALQTGSSMITLIVDNTSSTPPIINAKGLISSKHSGMGIGTESVRLIAERYNGDARFEWDDGVFCASITINP